MRALLLPFTAIALLASASRLAAQQNVTELYVQDSLTLRAGQRGGLSVQAFDDKGNAVLLIKYRSSDERTARVQSNGTVTGIKAGSAQITVQAGRKTKTVHVVVLESAPPADSSSRPGAEAVTKPAESQSPQPQAVPVATLSIEPSAVYLLPAENLHLNVRGFHPDGSPAAMMKVLWKSLRPEVASVGDSSGVVVGVGTGQGVIQASVVGGATASVPVIVALTEFNLTVNRLSLELQESETLHVVVPDQQNRELRASDLQWRTSDPGVVRVSPAGVVQAVGPGRTEVIASGFLQERRLQVTVHREIAEFAMRPAPGDTVRIPLLATREFRVRALASDSTPVTDVALDWQVGDTALISFDPVTGLVKGRSLGATTLSFGLKGFHSKPWAIMVIPAGVRIDPPAIGLHVGEHRKLAAISIDGSGKFLGVAPDVIWSSSSAAVAVVGADGTLEARSPGRANLSAVMEGGTPASGVVFVTGDLLFSSTRGGKSGVYRLQVSLPESPQPVLADSFSNLQAVYSPDRTQIAFTSDRGTPGNFDLYVADADGGSPRRLTTEPGIDNQPCWTPDGRHIVFASTRAGGSQIYIMNADGSGVRQLTDTPGGNQEPSVSSDGNSIVFSSGRDGNGEIYRMNFDGTGQTNLTQSKERRESSPAFFPNGDLAYVVEQKDGPYHYQVVRQATGSATLTPLVQSEAPIAQFAISADGELLAIATRVMDVGKGRSESTLYLQSLNGGPPIQVPLGPNERAGSPAF